jgi:hypothetical protein
MKGYMMMSVGIPIELSEYVESIDSRGERVPSGADEYAGKELKRMIDNGNITWLWEWEDE